MHIQSKTETKQKGREALGKEAGRLIGCPICKKELPAPTPRGTNSPWCPTCAVVVLRYAPFWDDNIRRRLETLMSRLSVARACDICRAPFSLERSVCASSSSSAGAGVDLLYPNLYVNICPACFGKAFAEHLGGSRSANAKRLHELFVLIGRAPTTDFGTLTYLLHDGETIVKYISLLQQMPSRDGYMKEFRKPA